MFDFARVQGRRNGVLCLSFDAKTFSYSLANEKQTVIISRASAGQHHKKKKERID